MLALREVLGRALADGEPCGVGEDTRVFMVHTGEDEPRECFAKPGAFAGRSTTRL